MDLISRKAAIDMLRDEYHGMISDCSMKIYQIINFLNEQPPTQQWIPVTERLPEESETVIASVDAGIYPEARFEDGRWWWALEAFADYWEEIKKDVTAWMPLPEPYKEVKND